MPGPVFANIVLADEINRTPPKTQAALLEAMQERHVTAGGQQHPLDPPFLVLATQNPIEQEGTYQLPEAQQDRFLFKVFVEYPTVEQEYEIAARTTVEFDPQVEPVFAAADVLRFQQIVRRVPAAEPVIRHALLLARATRPGDAAAPEFIRKMLSWGAGPRAVQAMILGGKARAALHGRFFLAVEDVRALARPVLRHRLVTNFAARAEHHTAEQIIERLLETIDPHQTSLANDERIQSVLS